MPRYSANLGFLWPDRPLLNRIDAAAKAGFQAIELHWPYDVPAEAVKARVQGHGLKLLGINTPLGAREGDSGLGAVAGREAEFLAGFQQAADYASATGAASVHVMAGLPEVGDFARGRRVFAANLAAICPIADARGLTLLLEPLNPRDKPGYFYHRVEDAADIIASVGHPALKIMFDCYHVQVGQGDVLRRLEAHFSLIGHIQIAAAPSRQEPDEGELNYRTVLAEIDRLGHQGWVGAEYKPRADTDAGLGWRQALG
jgi:hydroxypyruvate isomerase